MRVEISKNVEDANELQETIIDIFTTADVKVNQKNFQAVHGLRNKYTVIELSNRQNALSFLRNKKKIRDLNQMEKKKLFLSNKVYINELLCPAYRSLMGKCNALFKAKLVDSFYTISGKIKVITTDNKTMK